MSSSGFWLYSCLGVICTVIALYVLSEFKEEAKSAYILNMQLKSKTKDASWLRARTAHLNGLLALDRKGDGVRKVLDSFLQ